MDIGFYIEIMLCPCQSPVILDPCPSGLPEMLTVAHMYIYICIFTCIHRNTHIYVYLSNTCFYVAIDRHIDICLCLFARRYTWSQVRGYGFGITLISVPKPCKRITDAGSGLKGPKYPKAFYVGNCNHG